MSRGQGANQFLLMAQRFLFLLTAQLTAHSSLLIALRNFRELTFVILSEISTHRILGPPTTEPGRRG
jgi:hypothetical protein